MSGGFWDDAEIISIYTRAQAIDDGVLVDVSEIARESGFTVPVAMTRTVWSLVDPTEEEIAYGQDVNGRLWDVLMMAHFAIKRSREGGTELLYDVIFQTRAYRRSAWRSQRARQAHAGGGRGDSGCLPHRRSEPVRAGTSLRGDAERDLQGFAAGDGMNDLYYRKAATS